MVCLRVSLGVMLHRATRDMVWFSVQWGCSQSPSHWESCTAGHVSLAAASRAFRCGVITYDRLHWSPDLRASVSPPLSDSVLQHRSTMRKVPVWKRGRERQGGRGGEMERWRKGEKKRVEYESLATYDRRGVSFCFNLTLLKFQIMLHYTVYFMHYISHSLLLYVNIICL